MNIHTRRAIAYVVLTIISFFCLFWFYILFVNATRSNGQLQSGFTLAPSSHLLENWKNLLAGTLPVWNGMLNSIIVAGLSALVSVYFSTMTAYAIHAYDFGLKKFIYPFILMIMMIPTQVTALGFVQLVGKMHLEDSFIPLIVPTIAAPVTFFYMKQYMESALPLSLIEAARIDGSGEFHTFNQIVLPLMKPAIAVQAIFTFVSSWNNYFTPALILHDDKKKTLPILIAQLRAADWLKAVYGADTLEANLDYIAKALGNKGSTSREVIRNYFVNDFFKDHCQTYSVTGSGKRHIYWLFDSGKQNGFKALVYLHRYTPDTIGTLRVDYLHKMQRVYESEINRMQDMMDHTTNAREAAAASKRKDKLTKQLKECRDYDEKISHLALSRIALDLDDGVKVNYRKLQTAADGKFYEVLADSKNIMVKEKK